MRRNRARTMAEGSARRTSPRGCWGSLATSGRAIAAQLVMPVFDSRRAAALTRVAAAAAAPPVASPEFDSSRSRPVAGPNLVLEQAQSNIPIALPPVLTGEAEFPQ